MIPLSSFRTSRFTCWIAFVLCFIPTVCAWAHPFHLCVGQMKWNSDSKLWEVSIRLHPQDLEKALTSELREAMPEKRVSIDDADFPEVTTVYLSSHFFLRSSAAAMKREEFKAILEPMKINWPTVESSSLVSPANKDRSTLKWIGMEQERGWLWIHLELTAPKFDPDRQKLWFVNRILLDSVERQENTVAIDPVETKKYSLQFRTNAEFQEMNAAK